MAGPFPGMDPYLEDPALWPGVRQALITYAWGTLNHQLPPGYVANMGERVYVSLPARALVPDVMVLQRPVDMRPSRDAASTAAVADPPYVLQGDLEETREVFIEVLSTSHPEHVVTVIEVLSPTNKATGSTGRQLYREKQRELLRSRTHLLEIDLLRGGSPTVAAPVEWMGSLPDWQYLVCLHREGTGARYEVWPASLRQRLPTVSVPLLTPDPDVQLDLQTLLDRVYEDGAYARQIDYAAPPHPPLSASDASWAAGLTSADDA